MNLIYKEYDKVNFVLDILKSGLYSYDSDVCN
jgi:hypothetical protein